MRASIDLHVVATIGAARAFLSREGKYAAAPRPSCVLLDLHLPDGHGADLLDWIADHSGLSGIPVITLSGQPSARRWPNVVGSLTKPSDLADHERLANSLGRLIVAAMDGPQHRNDNFHHAEDGAPD